MPSAPTASVERQPLRVSGITRGPMSARHGGSPGRSSRCSVRADEEAAVEGGSSAGLLASTPPPASEEGRSATSRRSGASPPGSQLLYLDTDMNEDDDLVVTRIDHGSGPNGLSNYLYPIYLPMDQEFKTKYVFSNKRKPKSLQENVYLFLEHPLGWLCFVYHFSV